MPRKVFTAGEVLAASDVNSFLMDQTVMVFAGTAARGSAIGTATEGMYAHLNDTDTLTYYNGSAWVSAFTNPGLQLIESKTVGSGVSSVVFNDVFSASYSEYKIIYNINSASATVGMNMRLRVSGADNTSSNYKYGDYYVGALIAIGAGSSNAVTTTAFPITNVTDTYGVLGTIELASPFEAAHTKYTNLGVGLVLAVTGGGFLATTSFTGFTIYPASGTLTGGTISVYGYKKA
jgi:hypothetical protein